MEVSPKLEQLRQIMLLASDHKASDIHLAPRSPIMLRIDGALVPAEIARNMPITAPASTDPNAMPEAQSLDPNVRYRNLLTEIAPMQIEGMLDEMLNEHQRKQLEEAGELDYAYSVPGFSRLRINVFRQRGTYAMALRILSFGVPDPSKLGIPQSVINLANKRRGLVLVTGATGSGKSTTLAALIRLISENYQRNIITLEDPIEYLHKHGKSIVLQREVGFDTMSYANALRAALRQDPDVILVGEMRDLETISTAITAAETGHLVFSTLHTNTAAASVDRMIDVFPPHQQQQIRVQLAAVLEAVIAQQLLPTQGGGRAAAIEVMLCNAAIRNLIREGKPFQIPSIIQTSRKEGMQTMDDAIYDLYMQNKINRETAMMFAIDRQALQNRMF